MGTRLPMDPDHVCVQVMRWQLACHLQHRLPSWPTRSETRDMEMSLTYADACSGVGVCGSEELASCAQSGLVLQALDACLTLHPTTRSTPGGRAGKSGDSNPSALRDLGRQFQP